MKKLLNVGVTDSMTKHQARVIVLTNSIALIAAVLGFTGVAVAAAGIAKILFFIFLVLFLVSLVTGMRSPPA